MPPLPSSLPEEVLPLSWLLGSWVGVGLGQYPTIEDFRFGQEIVVANDGRPFLTYASRSWLLDEDGNKVRPLATETGYFRPRPDNKLEFLLAHPSGYSEVWLGDVEVLALETAVITSARASVRTDVVARTDSAKLYEAGERLYGLVNGELMWTFDMAAMGQPMTNHLSARLKPAEALDVEG
ncbi:MAG: FABP family protein [Candidatus Nanopelagicales bacterium]